MDKSEAHFHNRISHVSFILFSLSHLTMLRYEGGKFSKSRGTGVFGDAAKSTGLSPSTFRYYLLSHRPETSDTDFEWKSLIDANNNELKNNLGNFVNRVVVFINKKYDSKVPDYTKYTSDELKEWISEVDGLLKEYNETFEAVKIKAALAIAMRIGAAGNKLLQSNTLDNKTFEAEPDKIAAVLGLACNLILLLAAIIRPFVPGVSTGIASQLKIEATLADGELAPELLIPDSFETGALKPGHTIGTAQRLFEPIKPELEELWRDQFGGEEVRKAKEEKRLKAEKRKADREKKKAKKAGVAHDQDKEAEKAGKDVEEVEKKVEDLKV
jgi:methionyl-tRNA synthetase